jgi:anti-sigma factor RsiW
VNCSPDLIEAYMDEEIDAAQRAALERHFATCEECATTYASLLKQKADLRAAAPYYAAPPEVHRSVRYALGRMVTEEARPPRPETPWRSLATAASVLLVISIGANFLQLRSRSAEANLSESVFADHIRSLLGPGLIDVASSDQHAVKPWFAGKLDFSPVVKDLAADGFALAGGRVDYLADRRVAALVYHRRQHVISLFAWPAGSSSAGATTISRNGYNLVHWTEASTTYWAVSDVSLGDLETFRRLFRR